MEFGLRNLKAQLTDYSVTLVSDGAGAFQNISGTETFDRPFDAVPATCVIPPALATGDFEITSVTKDGFTWAITGSNAGAVAIKVGVFAHEKL